MDAVGAQWWRIFSLVTDGCSIWFLYVTCWNWRFWSSLQKYLHVFLIINGTAFGKHLAKDAHLRGIPFKISNVLVIWSKIYTKLDTFHFVTFLTVTTQKQRKMNEMPTRYPSWSKNIFWTIECMKNDIMALTHGIFISSEKKNNLMEFEKFLLAFKNKINYIS